MEMHSSSKESVMRRAMSEMASFDLTVAMHSIKFVVGNALKGHSQRICAAFLCEPCDFLGEKNAARGAPEQAKGLRVAGTNAEPCGRLHAVVTHTERVRHPHSSANLPSLHFKNMKYVRLVDDGMSPPPCSTPGARPQLKYLSVFSSSSAATPRLVCLCCVVLLCVA